MSSETSSSSPITMVVNNMFATEHHPAEAIPNTAATDQGNASEVRTPKTSQETAPEVCASKTVPKTVPDEQVPKTAPETAPEIHIPKTAPETEPEIPKTELKTVPELRIPKTAPETVPEVYIPPEVRISKRISKRLRSAIGQFRESGSNPVVDTTEATSKLNSAANSNKTYIRLVQVVASETTEAEGSTGGDAGIKNGKGDHVYADKGRILRKKRKSTASDVASTTCTVCGVTVRPCDLQSHYDWEVDKLNKMLRPDGTRYREQKNDKDRKKSKKRRNSTDDEDEEKDDHLNPDERIKKNAEVPFTNLTITHGMDGVSIYEFERIKNKRQERLYLRLRKNIRSNINDEDTPSTPSTISATEGDDNSMKCPICQIVLTGTAEERNSHAEACLIAKSSSGGVDEDDDVDIEGDGYEEYTWCGQTRVRVSSLLETGYKGLGFEVGQHSGDVDTELNIESDDDSAEFGPAQFGEADIIPCASDEMDEQLQTLRNAVLEGSQERVPPLHPEQPSCSNNNDPNTCNDTSVSNNARFNNHDRQEELAGPSTTKTKDNNKGINALYPGQSRTVLDSLRARIEELEHNKHDSFRCLICMESYKKPTVSVQCWHVHCNECWLRTLGAKKLCPQCNMITIPGQLRQIYL